MEWKIELGDDIEGFECFEIPIRTGNRVEARIIMIMK